MSEQPGTYAISQTVKVKRLTPEAHMPFYATAGAAAFDLAATNSGVVPAGGSAEFDTGLAFEIPPGHALLLNSRSGHGFKHGIRNALSQGILDSDYRGEARIKLHNDSDTDFEVKAGDRIAQALVVAAPQFQLVEVDELSETARGEGGFGSTGNQVN